MAAVVEQWVAEQKDYIEVVWKGSTLDLVEEVRRPKMDGGSMPIDTSFLQNSLVPSYTEIPAVNPEAKGGGPLFGSAALAAFIASAEVGGTMHFGFVAVYALRQNYGFVGWDSLGRYYNQSGNFFLERAIARWPEIVERNQRRLAAEEAFADE